jgi:hypothetical protein
MAEKDLEKAANMFVQADILREEGTLPFRI